MLIGAILGAALAVHPQMSREPGHNPGWLKVAVMCFAAGEQTSGMNKICYYNCLGSQVAINVPATALCPVTINR